MIPEIDVLLPHLPSGLLIPSGTTVHLLTLDQSTNQECIRSGLEDTE